MRFRSKGQPKGQILARQHRRIALVMVGLSIVVLLLIVSNSRSTDLFPQQPSAGDANRPPIPESLMGAGALQPDEFQVVPNETPAAAKDYASMIDRSGAAQMEQPITKDEAGPDEVPRKLTRTIRDDVIGVLASEAEAWFGTLWLAEKISPGQKNLIPEGQFALFMDSPQSCRGKAFTIRGTLRRLVRAPLPTNAKTFGVKSAYEAWISTRDSGNQLVHVVALSADAGLPLEENSEASLPTEASESKSLRRDPKKYVDVELTGYFFKREGYAAKGVDGKGDLALAPLILAGRIRYLPAREIASRADEMNPLLTWIGIGICGAVLLIVWQFQMSDSVFRGTRTHQLTNPPARPSFEGVESTTIQQVLMEMEQNAHHSSPDTNLLPQDH